MTPVSQPKPVETAQGPLYARLEAAEAFGRRLLVAHGLSEADAATMAGCLVRADLRGVDTHGLQFLPQYLERVRRGLVNPKPELESSASRRWRVRSTDKTASASWSPQKPWPRPWTWRASSASASSRRAAARISAWRPATRCRPSRPGSSHWCSAMPLAPCRHGEDARVFSAPIRLPPARRPETNCHSILICRRLSPRAVKFDAPHGAGKNPGRLCT